MNRSKIEQLFNSGQYKEALLNLPEVEPSTWTDTTQLRCLRALGESNNAKALAERLYQAFLQNNSPHQANLSEKNHQLRYISLVYAENGHADIACTIMRDLCKQTPNIASLHREYAFALVNNNQLDRGEVQLNKALEIEPLHAITHAQLALIYCRTGRTEQGFNSYSRAANIAPNNENYIQRLVYWSNYLEKTSQQDNHLLARLWAVKAHAESKQEAKTWPTGEPNKKLNIGFISSDFCAHTSSFFTIPLLKGLDRKTFQISIYSDTRRTDSVTESIQALSNQWCDSSSLNDTDLISKIITDKIDILVDLKGHTSGNRLGVFAKRAAPLQISWLGYPSTTGLKNMDYRITDRTADPIGQHEQYYSEKLLHLPNSFLCFQPLERPPEICPSDGNGHIRFGSFNNLSKISGLTLDAWSSVLHAVPNSTLYLKRQQLVSKNSQQSLIYEFKRRGIDKSRLILKPANATTDQHLEEYNNLDIALDTIPYNGTTTTLESLLMGVPVIALAGETHASRVSASILNHVGLEGFACSNLSEFRDRAIQLAGDEALRVELRGSLRGRMKNSPLMDEMQFAGDFGRALRQQWRHWCQLSDGSPANQTEVLS